MLANELPTELWFLVFLFVDDYDLPVLEKVNQKFHGIINDHWMRLLIQYENQLRVTGKLRYRPERSSLVTRNILRGPNQRQLLQLLQNGQYIDVLMNSMYKVGSTLSNSHRRKVLNRMLVSRPDLDRLENLFLVPTRIAPSLHPKITKLEHDLKRHLAKKNITRIDHRQKLIENMPTSKLLAPLQGVVKRNIVQKSLRLKLRERTEPLELLTKGILMEIQVG